MLVIGCGHPDCGDDAAGLLVARRLRELGVEAIECTGEATELLACWEGVPDVVVVDAMVTGGPVGCVRIWDASQMPTGRTGLYCSTHGLGVEEAVELARALGRLPARLRIIGIEGRHFSPGQRPSAAVLNAVERVVQALSREIKCTNRDS